MTIVRVVAVAVLCLSSAAVGAAQSAEQAVEQQITSTLHQMYEAEKRSDLQFIRAHLADDFAEVAGDGNLYHWSDLEANFKDVVLNDVKLSDCIFKLMTADSAYLICRMDLSATFKGQLFPAHLRVSYMWTRSKNDWLLRFEQGTVITEPVKDKQGKQD
jgi:hypothetical protein